MQQTNPEDFTRIIQDFSISERSIPPRVIRNTKESPLFSPEKYFQRYEIGEAVVIASCGGQLDAGLRQLLPEEASFRISIRRSSDGVHHHPQHTGCGDRFRTGRNVELGGALSITAGPLGRVAESRGSFLSAAVCTYSRSQGLFAGASLEGTIFIAQSAKNAKYYQQPVTPEEILSGRAVPPPGARVLIADTRPVLN